MGSDARDSDWITIRNYVYQCVAMFSSVLLCLPVCCYVYQCVAMNRVRTHSGKPGEYWNISLFLVRVFYHVSICDAP